MQGGCLWHGSKEAVQKGGAVFKDDFDKQKEEGEEKEGRREERGREEEGGGKREGGRIQTYKKDGKVLPFVSGMMLYL